MKILSRWLIEKAQTEDNKEFEVMLIDLKAASITIKSYDDSTLKKFKVSGFLVRKYKTFRDSLSGWICPGTK